MEDAHRSPARHSQGPLEAVVPGAEAGSPRGPPGRPGHQHLYPGQVSHQLPSQETGPCLVILCPNPPRAGGEKQRALRAAPRPPGRTDPCRGQGWQAFPPGLRHLVASEQLMVGCIHHAPQNHPTRRASEGWGGVGARSGLCDPQVPPLSPVPALIPRCSQESLGGSGTPWEF